MALLPAGAASVLFISGASFWIWLPCTRLAHAFAAAYSAHWTTPRVFADGSNRGAGCRAQRCRRLPGLGTAPGGSLRCWECARQGLAWARRWRGRRFQGPPAPSWAPPEQGRRWAARLGSRSQPWPMATLQGGPGSWRGDRGHPQGRRALGAASSDRQAAACRRRRRARSRSPARRAIRPGSLPPRRPGRGSWGRVSCSLSVRPAQRVLGDPPGCQRRRGVPSSRSFRH